MKNEKSIALYAKSKTLFPGGVNSPVRAFRAVDGNPIFIKRGAGCNIWDADSNEYIDYCCSWGPLILGHAHPAVIEAIHSTIESGTSFGAPTELENELAELIINNNPNIEMLRFVSSGTEAVMSAIRLARGVTGKDKIIKFAGCYHGHVDSLLVQAGSGLATLGNSSSAGVPKSFAAETIVLQLNDRAALEQAFINYKDQIACVVIEPVPANNGLLLQAQEYLQFIREICTKNNALLLFDEVISGFRIGFSGAAEHYNIKPDIMTFGKVLGGGLPVGAYGASKEIMQHISPEGSVYQAGTLSGNPVAMAAGLAQLKECLKPGFYQELEAKQQRLTNGIMQATENYREHFRLFSIASIFWISFSAAKAVQSEKAITAETPKYFKKLHPLLLEQGIYLAPSSYEIGFVSSAHSNEAIDRTIEAFRSVVPKVF